MKRDCAALVREIWACWPEGAIAREILDHAAVCDACRLELEALRALLRESSTEKGRFLSWSEVLPSLRWARLAASTRRTLTEPPKLRPLLWAPVLALAAALIFLARPKQADKPGQAPAALGPSVRSAEELEMLEHLDLFENWDLAVKLAAGNGKAL